MKLEKGQRREIFCTVAVCLVLVLLLLVLNDYIGEWDEKRVPAASCDELELRVNYRLSSEYIRIWESEEAYYFFLPSGVEPGKTCFANIADGGAVRIGGTSFESGENFGEAVACDIAYELELDTGENGECLTADKPLFFVQSAKLPTLYVDTETGSTETIHGDKEAKEKASVRLMNENGDLDYRGDIEYIKTRGNSTFVNFDKKSYQIKLFQEKNLLDMGKARKWILLANAQDGSYMRNKLVYDFAAEYTEVPSIEGRYVDLYLNGEYAGNYFLCERVEIGKNRLNITDLEALNKKLNSEDALVNGEQYLSEDGSIRAVAGLQNPEDITGGYLLEKIMEGEYSSCRSGFRTDAGSYYCVVSPQNASVEEVTYIRNYINEMETAIAQEDGIHPLTGKSVGEYLDLESWTSKYLVEEFFHDPDARYASIFFYKDSDQKDGLLYAGPMWDYDRAIGGYGVGLYIVDSPQQQGYFGAYAKELLRFDEVQSMVEEKRKRWIIPYANGKLQEEVNACRELIGPSVALDEIRWNIPHSYYQGWDANCEYLVWFLTQKADFLEGVWQEHQIYHKITFLDYEDKVIGSYRVIHGGYLNQLPEAASYAAVFAGWRDADTGMPLDMRLPVLEDKVYESDWIDVDVLLLNGLAIADLDAEQVDVEALEALVEELKKMQEEAAEDD